MHGSLGKLQRLVALGLALLGTAGCSTTPGSPFAIFSQGDRLLESAKALRSAAPEAAALPRELDKRVLPAYTVEPGDVLLVQPVEFDSPARLPGDQPVLPDGTINLGRYGRLVVAGKTVDEIEVLVRATVETQTKDAGPITVRLITRQSKVYYVVGEVNAPGSFPLQGRETVLDAILTAGGLTDRASADNIILSRPTVPKGCRVVLPICYREIVQLGDTSTNYQIRPGDRLFVPSVTFWEQLCPPKDKKLCPPCGLPQMPCPVPTGPCVDEAGHVADGILGKPVVPAPVEAEPIPAPKSSLSGLIDLGPRVGKPPERE